MTKPSVRFWGNEYASRMGTIFAETLADLVAKVDAGGDFPKGFLHTSTMPHEGTCYYDQVWARDAGRGAQELARNGYIREASWVVDYFLDHKNFGDHWGRLIDRKIDEDYELDGNTHILNAIAEVWRASGKSLDTGSRYLNECIPVFRWMEKCMDECPFGDLVPCKSELAGNPVWDDEIYAIYPNYGAAISIRNFVEMAKCCGRDDVAQWLKSLLDRIETSLTEVLVSKGQKTNVPEGVWLNGIAKTGELYETANFGTHFPIHHWTRQLPFVQNFDAGINGLEENAALQAHDKSYQYIRHEMAKGYYFRKYGFVSNTCWTGAGGRHDDTMFGYGQNYFTQAALLMDDVNVYGKCLEGIARLGYDGDVIENLSFEMNPFLPHECFSYDNYEKALDHTFGTYEEADKGIADNPGDEGNLVQAVETLKSIAMVIGVSVSGNTLVVKPRLPWLWDGVEIVDYPVVDGKGQTHRISLTYRHERWKRHCALNVTDPGGLVKIRVRFGPFPSHIATAEDVGRFAEEKTPNATFFWSEGGNKQEIQL